MVNFNKYKDTVIRLTKLKDNKFNGEHPNGINEGYIKEGKINLEKSNEHQCFLILFGDRFFNTSQVTAIEEHEGYDIATTLNSTYKVEPIFSSIPGVQEKHSVEVEDPK
jgi:hypothetical protein